MHKVLVCIPAITGTVHMGTMRALFAELLGVIREGWEFDLFEVVGCSLMEDARNLCASKFLDTGYTDLVFVDADVAWTAGAMVRLIKQPVDVVAAVYRHRADPVSWPVKWLADREFLQADPATGLLEVEAAPTGFMRITRAALLKMTEATPWYHDHVAPGRKSWMLFDRIRDDNGQKWGEDFAFCRRWRALGGQVWIDPEIEMGHIGNKTFTGHIGEWLKDRPAVTELQATEVSVAA